MAKEVVGDAAKKIAVKLIEAKQNNDGKTPYGYAKTPFGYASELVKDVKNSIPKLTLTLVNYYVAKQTASMAVSS